MSFSKSAVYIKIGYAFPLSISSTSNVFYVETECLITLLSLDETS